MESLVKAEKVRVETRVELYYEIHGAGYPLVLISGCGGDILNWTEIVPILSKHYKTIIFDNRGIGRSEVTFGDYSTRQFAEDMAALLDYLKVEKAHVLGWSMGGMIAQEYALAHPEKIDRLILCATAAKYSMKHSFVFWTWLEMLKQGDTAAVASWMMTWCFSEDFFQNPEIIAQTRAAFMNPPYPPTVEGFSGQIAALTTHDRRGQLGDIKAPTLVFGMDDDGSFHVKEVEALAKEIDGAELKIVEGGHALQLEKPQEFCNVVLEFLQKREREGEN